MNIVHVVSSLDVSAGGPSKSVSDLSLNQAYLDHKVSIFTNLSEAPYLNLDIHSNLSLKFAKKISFKKELNNFLNSNSFDLLHGHGIWEMPVHWMSKLAIGYRRPYLISPRGMLEPWALNIGILKKRLALAFYQRGDLAKSDCIHATALMEAKNIRNLGFTNPIAVIPNGIELRDFPCKNNLKRNQFKTVFFLSRIHPKKGIELLIEAWSHLDKNLKKDWRVVIAGNGEEYYINSLKKLILKNSLESEIEFIGPQFGESKVKAYHQADLFVLPTYSENFGIVVAEALACGVPVITTKGTPWEELNTNQAGWWIDIGVNPLIQAFSKALQLNESTLTQMGINGRNLIQEKYSIESVAKQMIELYQWILDGGKKPEFIFD